MNGTPDQIRAVFSAQDVPKFLFNFYPIASFPTEPKSLKANF